MRYGLILLLLYLPINSVYALAVDDILKPITPGINLKDGTNVTYTFSGSTANYINYIRLCKSTNSACSDCSAPYATYGAITNSGQGIPYSTTGTEYGLRASAIQNYLSNNNLGDGTYYIGLYVQSKDLVCNTSGAYCSTNHDNAGHVLCVQAVSSGGTTALTQEDNGNAELSSNTTPYLYVNNGTGNTISVCPASATPFTCTTANNSGSTPTAPYGIAIDPPSKNVYVISRTSTTANSLSCSIDPTNGGLTCSTLRFTGALCTTAQGIAIDPPGQYAYVTCSNNTVYKCALGGSTCNQITLSGTNATLANPTGIVIDPTNTYMAIANAFGGGYLTACNIGGTGCVIGNYGNPIAYVTVDHTGTYLYTGKSTGSSVYSCPVTITGGIISIGTCSNKASGTTKVFGIALNPSGTNAYIAIQGSTGLINSCPTSPGAAVSDACTGTSSTGLSNSMQGAAWGNVVGP